MTRNTGTDRSRISRAATELGLGGCGLASTESGKNRGVSHLERMQRYIQRLRDHGLKIPKNPFTGGPYYKLIKEESGLPYKAIASSARKSAQFFWAASQEIGLENRPALGMFTQPVITYRVLMESGSELRKKELEGKRNAKQQLYNTRAALKQLREHLKRNEEDFIGVELTSDFDRVLIEITESIGVDSTRHKFQTEIKRWQVYYRQILNSLDLPEDFHEALIILIDRSRLPISFIARGAKVPSNAIDRWYRKESSPRPTSCDKLYRIESFLMVPAGTLVTRANRYQVGHRFRFADLPQFLQEDKRLYKKIATFLPDDYLLRPPDQQREIAEYLAGNLACQGTGWQTKIGELTRLPYKLKLSDWPEIARMEFNDLSKFKMAMLVPVGKHRTRRWRKSTCDRFAGDLSSFFGSLVLSPDVTDPRIKGLGVDPSALSLTLLLCPELVHWHLIFRYEVRGGRYNSYALTFLDTITSLLKPKTGWLWQSKELADHLPIIAGYIDAPFIDRAKNNWPKVCKSTLKYYKRLRVTVAKEEKQSRDPFEPISGITDLDDPMMSQRMMIAAIRKSLPNPSTSKIRHAIQFRRLVSETILTQTGLRARNMVELTYFEDNSGYFRKEGGKFVIEIPAEEFKCPDSPFFGEGKIKSPYRLVLADVDGSYEDFEKYLTEVRPFLLKEYHNGQSSEFLLISTGKDPKMSEVCFSNERRKLTAVHLAENKYRGTGIAGVRRHGPHAARYIRGSAVVKKTGSFQTAADANHHSELMARKHYTRFLPVDRNRRVISILFPDAK